MRQAQLKLQVSISLMAESALVSFNPGYRIIFETDRFSVTSVITKMGPKKHDIGRMGTLAATRF